MGLWLLPTHKSHFSNPLLILRLLVSFFPSKNKNALRLLVEVHFYFLEKLFI